MKTTPTNPDSELNQLRRPRNSGRRSARHHRQYGARVWGPYPLGRSAIACPSPTCSCLCVRAMSAQASGCVSPGVRPLPAGVGPCLLALCVSGRPRRPVVACPESASHAGSGIRSLPARTVWALPSRALCRRLPGAGPLLVPGCAGLVARARVCESCLPGRSVVACPNVWALPARAFGRRLPGPRCSCGSVRAVSTRAFGHCLPGRVSPATQGFQGRSP